VKESREAGAADDTVDSILGFEPCDVCGNEEANFDGFCSHCEIPMTRRPNFFSLEEPLRGAGKGEA